MSVQTSMPEAAALVRVVARCRRRLVFAAFARYACVACCLALVAVAVASRLPPIRDWLNPWLALGAALGVSGAAALLVRPSLRDTSAAIDRRLGLADVVAAGMELRERTDPMAMLVVRAAAARIGQSSPARLFPVRLRRREGVSLGLAVVLSVMLAADGMRTTRRTQHDASAANSDTAAGGPAGASTSTAQTPAAAGQQAGASASRAAVARDTPLGTERPSAGPQPAGSPSSAVSRPGSQEPAASRGGFPTREGTRLPEQGGSEAQRSAEQTNGMRAALGRSGGTEARTSAPDTRLGRDGRGGAPGAATATGLQRTGAGGIGGGALGAPGETRAAASLADQPSYSARYAAARARAEAALAREEIPPRYRALVRRYFAAIERPDHR